MITEYYKSSNRWRDGETSSTAGAIFYLVDTYDK